MRAGRVWAMLGLLACAAAAQEQTGFEFTRISPDSNVRSDRRPIHVGFYDSHADKTFVSWMGANSHPIVKELDHRSGRWSDDKVVAQSPFVDKHNYPALLRGPDGRLFVFYGCHNSPLYLATSPKPLSIDGKWEQRVITEAPHASYPAPVLTREGAFYVFYRETRQTNGHSDDRPYDYVKSTDLGKTWTHGRFVDPYPRTTDSMCEVYNGKVTYQPAALGVKARIHVAWTICGEKVGRHAHATYGRNVYYAYLDPANDHIYNIHSIDLGTQLDNKEIDDHCLVLDTGIPERGHAAGLQVSVHYRDNGSPLIYFHHMAEGGLASATWDGSAWSISRIAAPGSDPRGDPRDLEKCGPDSFRVYIPTDRRLDIFATNDAGRTWNLEGSARPGPRIDHCYVIDDAHPAAKLLITEAGDNTLDRGTRDVFIGAVVPQRR